MMTSACENCGEHPLFDSSFGCDNLREGRYTSAVNAFRSRTATTPSGPPFSIATTHQSDVVKLVGRAQLIAIAKNTREIRCGRAAPVAPPLHWLSRSRKPAGEADPTSRKFGRLINLRGRVAVGRRFEAADYRARYRETARGQRRAAPNYFQAAQLSSATLPERRASICVPF